VLAILILAHRMVAKTFFACWQMKVFNSSDASGISELIASRVIRLDRQLSGKKDLLSKALFLSFLQIESRRLSRGSMVHVIGMENESEVVQNVVGKRLAV
jgi:hypothetical protein